VSTCSAAWYELNLSAPDNNVSACCYYAGDKEEWRDDPIQIDHYWNGPGIRAIRRLQAQAAPTVPNGCSSCFYYQQMLPGASYFSFAEEPAGMSPLQSVNWKKAKQEFEARVETVECTPLRVYANFGYACNLSCSMCHQVPRRGELKRQILADTVLAWPEILERALEMCVIGGEPFALPEALKFIRKFAVDPRFDPVRLFVYTNGTVVQKHFEVLKKKRLLWLCVSLDGVGEGFEKIRLGGKWPDVERNLLTAKELQVTTHPEWTITTNANIQKAGLPNLPAFARWHVKHGIRSFFFDFISAPGVEDTYTRDNILQNPHILDDMPAWREPMDEAIEVFRSGGFDREVGQLEQYRDRVDAAAEATRNETARRRRQRGANNWTSLLRDSDEGKWTDKLTAHSPAGKSPFEIARQKGMLGFVKTRLGDHFATEFVSVDPSSDSGKFRVRAHWPRGAAPDGFTRLAHVVVQNQDFSALPDFREFLDFGFGTELAIVGDLPKSTRAVRLVFTPLGEELTLLPERIEFDVDPETTIVNYAGRWSRRLSEFYRAHAKAREFAQKLRTRLTGTPRS
jgi:organic radical activating enzyme